MPKLILVHEDGTQVQQWSLQTKYANGMTINRDSFPIFKQQLEEGLRECEKRRDRG